MPKAIIESLKKKVSNSEIISTVINDLSLSQLNSLLLEVFREKVNKLSPSDLLKYYNENRYVHPTQINTIDFLDHELIILKIAQSFNFEPLELSPVSPLGTCSVVAPASQNKIISATRGTEVVADATNVLALEVSKRRKMTEFDDKIVRLCTIHRHVRGQIFQSPGFTPHFKVFCATSAGRDSGNYQFEQASILNHLHLYQKYMEELDVENVKLELKSLSTPNKKNNLFDCILDLLKKEGKWDIDVINVDQEQQQYYHQLQFKIFGRIDGHDVNIGDGGFVDWSQKLTTNRKERLLISGVGIELVYKALKGLLPMPKKPKAKKID